MAKLHPTDGGCWFCHKDDEDKPLVLDTEFDTFVHIEYVKHNLKNAPDFDTFREAEIMSYLLESDKPKWKEQQMEYLPLEIKFYIGDGPWATTVDKVIRLRSDKTHVEAKFPDRIYELVGRSFSSSIRKDISSGKSEGVRLKNIMYSHPERWVTYILWVTREELDVMYRVAMVMNRLDIKYDKRAILGFLITGRHNPRAYFCSEVVYALLATCFLFPGMNHKMHPDALEKVVKKLADVLLDRKMAA